MARKPYITRTMQNMIVTAMVCDTETAEVGNITVTLGHLYRDAKALEKAVKARVDNGTTKFVAIVDTEISTGLYGMSEDAFLANAERLDPETRRPIED